MEGYAVLADFKSPGGDQVAGVNTEGPCRAACDAHATCVGFDLTTAGCWLRVSLDNPVIETTEGVTHYRRIRTCSGKLTSQNNYDYACVRLR